MTHWKKAVHVSSSIIILIFTFLASTAITAVTFQDWSLTQSQQFVNMLVSANAQLPPEEMTSLEQTAKEAEHKNEWLTVVTARLRLAGKDSNNIERWFDLSIALNHVLKQPNVLEQAKLSRWDLERNAISAAIQAYQLAKTFEEKTKALLVYGDILTPNNAYDVPSYFDVYDEIKSLANLPEFRKNNPTFAKLMPFQYLSTRVNLDNAPASACLLFSHPLKKQDINYADYISITPKIEGAITARGREICFSPLEFGGNYEVTLKAGLPSELLEKLTPAQALSVKVSDQNARLSFSNKSYVLIKDDRMMLPLSGVNVEVVQLKVLRITDRGLSKIIQGQGQFLENVWSYRADEIENSEGELIWSGEMDLSAQKNQTLTKQIPFSDLVKDPLPGLYIIQAQEKAGLQGNTAVFATQWLVVSDIGLTAFTSRDAGITVNARSLKTADPRSNIELQLLALNNSILQTVKTDANGMANFSASQTLGKGGNQPAMILAYGAKGDFTLLDLRSPAFDLSDRGVQGREATGPFDIFMYTEQGVYRPGSVVHLNALLRSDKGQAKGQFPLTFKVLRPDELEISQHTLTGDALGHYELPINLPEASRIGEWTVLAYVDPRKDPIGRVKFVVEDFVPSRVEISMKSDQSVLTREKPVSVSVEGRYLFGSPASGMQGESDVSLQEKKHPFPQYSDYAFGLITEDYTPTQKRLAFVPLDKAGKETVLVALDKIPETSKPLEAVVSVTLQDEGGRPEIARLTLPVSILPYRFGIKPNFQDNLLSENSKDASFKVIAIDETGQLKPGVEVAYELYLEDKSFLWYQSQNTGTWGYKPIYQDKFITKGQLKISEDGTATVQVAIANWGQYRLEIRDPQQTQIASSVRFNKGWQAVSEKADAPDFLTIALKQSKINIGEAVTLDISAPFDGQALITVANHKVLETKNVSLSAQGTRITLTPTEEWGTGVYCMVSAFRPLNQKIMLEKPFLPKRAIGIAWLGVNSESKLLDITLDNMLGSPASNKQDTASGIPEVRPNQAFNLPIQVTRRDGKTLNKAFVSIAAVDEGILKLTNFKTPDPENFFFGQRQLGVECRDVYGKLIQPLAGAVGKLRSGGGGEAGLLFRELNLQGLSKVPFKIVSLYKGVVELDRDGKAKVTLNLPDFNGRLRIMAVAFDEERLGSQQRPLLVRDPVVLEAVLPRFLAPGDTSQMSMSLHNVAGLPGIYRVNAVASGQIVVTEGSVETNLKKSDVYNAYIPVTAKAIGDGNIQLVLTGPDSQEKAAVTGDLHARDLNANTKRNFDLAVRSPVPYQNDIKSTLLKPNETIEIKEPNWLDTQIPESIKVLISWSASVPWDNNKLISNLEQYQYGCTEQTVSKGIAALFSSHPNADRQLNNALARLSVLQNADGSFSLWPNDSVPNAWLTAYVVDFLQRTAALKDQKSSVSFPRLTLERGLDYLKNYLVGLSRFQEFESATYALYVLSRTNKIETGSIRYFFDNYYNNIVGPLSSAMIGAALVNRNDFARAKMAFEQAYYDEEDNSQAAIRKNNLIYSTFGSTLRDNAGFVLLLQESILKDPKLKSLESTLASLLQALSREISQASLGGLSTNEQAWAILASESFGFKKEEPISLRINDKLISTQNNSADTSASLSQELSNTDIRQGISLQNVGNRNVWQMLWMSGIPKAIPAAKSAGFEIKRDYYTLEGKAVSIENGQLNVKQGTQLLVVLQGKTTIGSLPHQLLILDLLPAGFEIDSVVTRRNDGKTVFSWLNDLTQTLYSEPRDDRFVASMTFDQTTRHFKMAYIVRAVSIGDYRLPGFFVEDMYSPKYFARTDEGRVRVTRDE